MNLSSHLILVLVGICAYQWLRLQSAQDSISSLCFAFARFRETPTVAIVSSAEGLADPVSFLRDYVSKSKPVIIRGGCAHFPAFGRWTLEYLAAQFADRSLKVETTRDRTFRYTDEGNNHWMTFAQFVNASRSNLLGQKLYITGSDIADSNNKIGLLTQDLPKMSFVTGLHLHSIGLWVGGIGSHPNDTQITPLHFDEMENIMCVISGKKIFTVIDPTFSDQLDAQFNGQVWSAGVNITGKFEDARNKFHAQQVTLGAGDLFFSPAFYWHEVESSGDPNIGVNFFFYPHSLLLHQHYVRTRQHLLGNHK